MSTKKPKTPTPVAIAEPSDDGLPPTDEAETQTKPITDVLAKFTAKRTEASDAVTAAQRAEIDAEVQPFVTAAKNYTTRMEQLRKHHQVDVETVANTFWDDVLAALPHDWTMSGRQMVSPSRQAVHRLRDAAERARSALRSTFGDSTPSGRDIDPVNMAGAVQALEAIAAGGVHCAAIREADDAPVFVKSAIYLRSLSHAKWWVERGRKIVESAGQAVKVFREAEALAKDILGSIVPAEVAPTPPRTTLPDLATPPERPATAGGPWSPFDESTPPSDEPSVHDVGAGAGKRVGDMVGAGR